MILLKRAAVAVASVALVTGVAGIAAGPAFATGQPNQSCQAEPASPGHASSAPGSAFNEDPGGVAGGKYAGSQPQNSKNPASVSQYDVACTQVSTH
ncbi:hypothetical protein [Streptomyces sp. NPDC005799]|uniref:hypothetical protein n=1 Tax=Streptomyces sp. NPDC005799 TaxID=3154678 RepID=UPI0033FA0602